MTNARCLFVTGASADLGLALLETLHPRYDKIFAHYRRPCERLEALAAETGGKITLLQADFSEEASVIELLDRVRALGVVPTHMVHLPAEKFDHQKMAKTGWPVFQSAWDISVRSLVLLAQGLLPAMAKQGGGKLVVMLSSATVHMPPKYCTPYVVSKYALLGLVKSLAVEYAGQNITVNGISPAVVETKFMADQPAFIMESRAAASPIGRNLTPDDVVPSIAFLLSEAADCINGQNLVINGGE